MIINTLPVPQVSQTKPVSVRNKVQLASFITSPQPERQIPRSGSQFLQGLWHRVLGERSLIETTLSKVLNQPLENMKTVSRILKSETFKPLLEQLRQATETTTTWEKQFPNAIKRLSPAAKDSANWFEPLTEQQAAQNTYFPLSLLSQHENWQHKKGALLVDVLLPQLAATISTVPAYKKNDVIDRLQRTVGLLKKTLSPIHYPLTPEHPFYLKKPLSSDAIQRWLGTVTTEEKPLQPLQQLQYIIQACQTKPPSYEQTSAVAGLLQQGIINARLTGDKGRLNKLVEYSYDWLAIQLADATKIPYTAKQ